MQKTTILRFGLLTAALCGLIGLTGCSSNKQDDTSAGTTGASATSGAQTPGGPSPDKGATGTMQQRKPDM